MKLLIPLNYCSFFFFLCSSILAQNSVINPIGDSEFYFEHISVEQGLSHSTVIDIVQDKQGFLWFSTWSGLSRYDGFTFMKYFSDPVDTNSLSDNSLRGMAITDDGKIWIGSSNGLTVYDPLTDKLTQVSDLLNDDEILHAQKDDNGDLWFKSDYENLLYYNYSEATFTKYPLREITSIKNIAIRCFWVNSDNKLLIGTTRGLFSIDVDSIKMTGKIKIKQIIKDKIIWSMLEDEDKNLWIGTDKGVITFPDKDVAKKAGVNLQEYITDFMISDDKKLWVGTYYGLHVYDLKKNKQSGYLFPDDHVEKIYQDNSNVIWVSIRGEGLYKFSSERKQFPAAIDVDVQVFSVFEDDDKNLWIGSHTGILKINQLTKTKKNYKIQSPNFPPPHIIIKNKYGEMFTGGLGVTAYSKELDKFMPLNVNHSISPDFKSKVVPGNFGWVFTLFDDDEYMWIGCNGLLRYEYKTRRLSRILNRSTGENLFPNFVTNIHKDKKNNMWIGSSNGLFLFDPESEKIEHFTPDQSDLQSISDNYVSKIIDSKEDNILWIATGFGLNKFDTKTRKFLNYTTEHGLSNNGIQNLFYDEKGFLWMSTNNGISRFDPQDETFKNYYKSDGLQDNAFSSAYFKNSDGKIFLGGSGGITAFYPDSIRDNLDFPNIVITSFKLFNQEAKLDTAINHRKKITLLHNENVFSFEYAALDFTNSLRNQFAHKLEGFDKDWIFTGNKHDVTYTNLDPGEYTFHVKGTNHDGIWNEKGTSLRITILPPIWATWWAYLIYAISFLILVYFLRRYELNRLSFKHGLELKDTEARKLHEVDNLKSKFFTNISHEFRTPLTLIFGPAKDISEKAKDEDIKHSAGIIKRNANKLFELINQLLDLSKLEAGKMTLETSEQDIIPLLKGLVLSFTSFAERKKITLQFNTIVDYLNVYIDNDKIDKIITNLLSNAFKFTPKGGKIDFTVEKLKKEVEMRISDNGIGIPEERIVKIFDRFYQVDGSYTGESGGTGIGLALTKELVELHKGYITVDCKEGEGTTFRVRLPLGKEHLKPEEIVEKEIKGVTTKTIEETEFIPGTEKRKATVDILLETSKPQLLVVEDNLDVKNYIVSHLEKDYGIEEAIDGEDGFTKSIEQIPDLIVSDVMMPKMDGFQFCAKIKIDERTSHIPIILLTAKASGESKIEGLETGADDYIMKPFDAKELKVRIKNLIEQRKKLREHFQREGIFNLDNKNITSVDKKFLEKAVKIINEHLSDSLFGVELFANKIALGRATLHKKLVALIGEPPSELIKRMRLDKAAKLIEINFGNISGIALEVGFNNPAYFSECFRKQFGVTPSQYQRNFTNH
jgi:signal transduction histidine kinase/ligand-binding sensor domain-containing protein/AraC-like DNA-binding protein